MVESKTIIKVVHILRDFMRNEAQTLEISKGKMLDDREAQNHIERILRTG